MWLQVFSTKFAATSSSKCPRDPDLDRRQRELELVRQDTEVKRLQDVRRGRIENDAKEIANDVKRVETDAKRTENNRIQYFLQCAKQSDPDVAKILECGL
jgi:hypothetical protein